MQFLIEYGLFLAKAITLVVAALAVLGAVVAMVAKQKKTAASHMELTDLNKQYEGMEESLSAALLSPQQQKQKIKADKARAKQEAKKDKANKKSKANKKANNKDKKTTEEKPRKRIFVLDFDGDIRASGVSALRQEISALLTYAKPTDEVVVRLESPGGTVPGYGLAASQLQRVRAREIPLTICVDKVAASGGYMMACVANQIIAAPFAIIGSVGVLAQIPNLHRLLKKHDIDFEQLFTGEYKRTLTLFGENTDKGREKMKQDLEEIHALFKSHIKSLRPGLDVERIATGEHWLGTRAHELGLVDKLQTSDDYLMAARKDAQLISLKFVDKKKLLDRIASIARLRDADTNTPLLM